MLPHQTISIADNKQSKRCAIYSLVYNNMNISKPEIASTLSMSLPTVSQYIVDLQADGLIVENGILDSTGGRKPVALICNPTARVSVGLSLSMNTMSGVVVDLYGSVLSNEQKEIPFENSDIYARALAEIVDLMLEKSGSKPDCVLGVSVSVPGIVSIDGEEIVFSHIFPVGLKCTDICRYIRYPTRFYNDANAAGFAEIWNSPFDGTAAYLSINDTIGGAIIMDGSIYAGMNNRSGEFGHVTLNRDGPRCRCGQRGCLGCYCGASTLTGDYGQSLDRFFAALAIGEEHAKYLWNDYIDYLATGIAIYNTVLDCDIIVGGVIGVYMEPYIVDLRARVAHYSTFGENASFVRVCRHKVLASAVGAALQRVQGFLENI